MKSRFLVSLLVIAMAAALIGGGTMAWFTDTAEPDDVTFTAGTVVVGLGDGGIVEAEGYTLDNWNPGDCNYIEQEIIYTGSKAAKMRVIPSASWSGDLDLSNITITFCEEEYGNSGTIPADWKEGTNWRFVGSGDNINSYYIEYIGDILGATDADGDVYKLCLKICIDGPSTGNVYQGETFTLGGTVQVIQASHSDEWTWQNVDFETGLGTQS